jgi:hypothetical protein
MRITIFVLCIIIGNILVSVAQDTTSATPEFRKTVFGFKAGVNLSRFSASINSETRAKVGPAFGIYFRKQTSKNFYFRPELYYSNQGQRNNYIYPSGSGPAIGRTTVSTHYINAPLLFEVGREVTFQFGMQLGLLLGGKEKGTYASATVDDKVSRSMETVDFSAVLGIGYSLLQHFNCGARLNYGVVDISKSESLFASQNISVSNRVIHFYVGYSF